MRKIFSDHNIPWCFEALAKLAFLLVGVCFCLVVYGKERVLIIDASDAEKKELARDKVAQRYVFDFYDIKESNENGNEDLVGVLDQIKQKYMKGELDGVLSSQDYLGNICACLVADAYTLPGPSPKALLTCHHKFYSREVQKKYVPEATPQYGLIDPHDLDNSLKKLPFNFPFFVKPIKASFSFGAEKIKSKQELEQKILSLLPAKAFLKPLEGALQRYTDFKLSADYLLAEEILEGKQVTVEGFVQHGKVRILGIIDSIMYPGTISFEHFEYPSRLAKRVRSRMEKIAITFIKGIEFDNSFFNIEMMYNPETNKIHIIEVNPRCSAQFADFYERVDGINSYDIMLLLATNSAVPKIPKKKGPYGVAASFALRVYEDGLVKRSPTQQELAKVQEAFPDARIQLHVQKGQMLSDELQDGKSYLYCIINLGGKHKQDLLKRFATCRSMLPFAIEFGKKD